MKFESGTLYTILIAVVLCTILTVAGSPSQAAAQERKVSVPPSELPTVIKKAIKQAFPNGGIVTVEKEVEGEDPGQYDVLVNSDGKDYELEISPEGEVIENKEVASEEESGGEEVKQWTKSFGQENCTFSTVGRNRFFSLMPGDQLVLQSSEEKVVITVLDETKKIGGVRTRIVEEREEKDGELAEVSRNFFAICKKHGDVFYFGEEVDDYKDGKIVAHSGAWRADEADSKAGIIMPGTILLGARHYQEIAPNAMDRAEIISDDVTMTTPAGTFKNCLRVEETSGLDPDEKYFKTYAPGVGLIQDEDLLLIRYKEAKVQMKRDQIIIDKLQRAEDYYDMHPAFENAFAFLRQDGLAELPAGRHEIDGDRLFCMISKGSGRSRAEAKLEAHRKYIDIQYVIAGTDEMGWRPTANCELTDTSYDADKDIEFFKDQPDSWTPVPAGSFVIFFPQDAHAPLVSSGEIHKVVLKIAVE